MPDKNKRIKNKLSRANILLNRHIKKATILVFVVVLLAGFYFLLIPRIKNLRELSKSLLPAKMAELEILDIYSNKIDELETLIKSFQNKYSTQIKDLEQVLPTKAQLPELIAQLDALFQKSGFSIISLTFAETDLAKGEARNKESSAESEEAGGLLPEKNLRPIELTLDIAGGDYPAFKALLNKIEKHIRLLDIISVSFGSGREEGIYTLNMRTYYFEAGSNP